MRLYRNHFHNLVDISRTSGSAMFQMLVNKTPHRYDYMTIPNGDHTDVRRVCSFDLNDAITIAEARLKTLYSTRWIDNWRQLIMYLHLIRDEYANPYAESAVREKKYELAYSTRSQSDKTAMQVATKKIRRLAFLRKWNELAWK